MARSAPTHHPAKPATVYDVADLAGVSAQTVSRLLRGERVSDVTRGRVEAAISELGYRTNRAAQLLRTRRSTRLGALVHEMFTSGPAMLLRGAAAAAREAGYSLSIVGVDGASASSVSEAFDTFREEQVAGIIAVTLTDDVREVVQHRATEFPVIVDPAETSAGGMSSSIVGGGLAAQHLIEFGHTHLGLITGPMSWLPARQRRDGFMNGLRDAASVVHTVEGDWSPQSGFDAALQISANPAITAVFAANDSMAIGCIRGFESLGYRVPEDISVIGFDDIPESSFIGSGVSTIRPRYENEGRAAVLTLLAKVAGREPTDLPDRRTVIVRRGSTGPVPEGNRFAVMPPASRRPKATSPKPTRKA